VWAGSGGEGGPGDLLLCARYFGWGVDGERRIGACGQIDGEREGSIRAHADQQCSAYLDDGGTKGARCL
jgi:hypothetical protein